MIRLALMAILMVGLATSAQAWFRGGVATPPGGAILVDTGNALLANTGNKLLVQ